MKSRTRFLARTAALAAVAAAVAPASAHGVSRWIGGLETAVAAAKVALAAEPSRLKQAKLVGNHISAKTNARSLSDELNGVSKAAKVFEAKLMDQPDLSFAFMAASQGYTQDLSATRRTLELAANSTTMSKLNRSRFKSSLKRFDAAFSAKRKPTTPLTDQFARSAVATKVAAGFTPYDAGKTYDWVISSLQIAAPGIGVDLSGDGQVDNQLGAIQATLGITDLNDLVNDAIANGGRFAILEMWYVKTLSKPDPVVLVGVMGAADADADPANNFTGAGVFLLDGGAVSIEDGHSTMRTATSLAARGKYAINVSDQTFQLGGVVFPLHSKLVIKANAKTDTNFGLLGLGIPTGALVSMAASAGVPLDGGSQLLLEQLADLDLDPLVPGNDAISVSCNFTAVKCTVTRP